MSGQIPVAMGSAGPMPDKHTPVPTDAARLIIERALSDEPGPLYVLGLGQFTNLASALLMEPRIRDRVVFACIDGDYRHGQNPAWGPGCYNWPNDVPAVQAIFESDVPYIHLPAPSVTDKMRIDRETVEKRLADLGGVYAFLLDLWSKEISHWIMWDIALIHAMIDPDCGRRVEVPAPIVHDDGTTTDCPGNPRTLTVYAEIDPQEIYRSYWQAVADTPPIP
jgi:inosine-uridine nucleoside N-ribohydrolase